jgi:hypothetical protein
VQARSATWRRTATLLGAFLSGAGILGFASWVGCSIYNPSLLLPEPDEGGPDVVVEASPSHDAGDAATEAPPPTCPEVFPPAAPAADDPSDAGDQTAVLALHTLDLGIDYEGGAPPAIGYDLDSVYTCCDAGAESCKAASVGATHCDEAQGRDNSGEQLLSSLASLDSNEFNDTTISERLQAGAYSILIQLLHYNGQPNDTQVTAALYASDGIQPDGDAAVAAKWDGTDVWTVDDGFVVSPDASPPLPTHFDANAYVSNGTLVMHVDFPISLGTSGTGSLSITLTSGVITATVGPSQPPGTFHLTNGVIAGRWNISNLLGSLQSLDLTFGGTSQALCRGTSTYSFIKQQICAHADIMTDYTKDKTGATCDALSIGFAFSADPALMGAVTSAGTKGTLCGDGGDDDAAPDDCTTP